MRQAHNLEEDLLKLTCTPEWDPSEIPWAVLASEVARRNARRSSDNVRFAPYPVCGLELSVRASRKPIPGCGHRHRCATDQRKSNPAMKEG